MTRRRPAHTPPAHPRRRDRPTRSPRREMSLGGRGDSDPPPEHGPARQTPSPIGVLITPMGKTGRDAPAPRVTAPHPFSAPGTGGNCAIAFADPLACFAASTGPCPTPREDPPRPHRQNRPPTERTSREDFPRDRPRRPPGVRYMSPSTSRLGSPTHTPNPRPRARHSGRICAVSCPAPSATFLSGLWSCNTGARCPDYLPGGPYPPAGLPDVPAYPPCVDGPGPAGAPRRRGRRVRPETITQPTPGRDRGSYPYRTRTTGLWTRTGRDRYARGRDVDECRSECSPCVRGRFSGCATSRPVGRR
jgi:hypothetical protein